MTKRRRDDAVGSTHRRNKRVLLAAATAAASVFSLAPRARAANEFFDLNGSTAGFGTFTNGATYDWDGTISSTPVGPYWSTDSAGGVATTAWPQSNFPRFNPTGTPTYTVTMSNAEHNLGMFFGTSQTVTLVATGSGALVIDGGVQQGFFGAANTTVNINAPIQENVAGGGPSFSRAATGNTPLFVLNNTGNSFTGGVSVNTGVTLKLGVANVIPGVNVVTLGGGIINLNSFDTTFGGLASGSATAAVQNFGSTLTLNTAASTVASFYTGSGSAFQGTVTVIKTGSGVQKMVANSMQSTGVLKILGGTWQIDSLNVAGVPSGIGAATADPANLIIDGGTLLWIGKTTLGTVGSVGQSTDRGFTVGPNGATISTEGALNPLTFTGNVVGSASSGSQTLTLTGSSLFLHTLGGSIGNGTGTNATNISKTGVGTWMLSGVNTYTGTTTVSGGTLVAGAAGALPTGSALIVNGGTLDTTGNNQSVPSVSMQSGAIVGPGATLTSATDYDIRSGSISANLAGSVALNKTTSGTASISGANSYTGNTTISLGRLNVNNTSGSGTSTGSVTVNATDANNYGTLGGTGSITGAVTVNANAHLAPGANGGNAALTLNTVTMKADSTFDFSLGNAGSGDMLIVTQPSGLTLDTTGSGIENVRLLGGQSGTYHLIEYDTALGSGSLSNLNVLQGPGTGIDSATLSLSDGPGTLHFIDVTVSPTSRTWVGTGSGNWSDGTKWGSTATEPNGVGAAVSFAGSIAADSTITIDNADKTVGPVTIDNSTFKYTIAASGSNKLILDGVGTLPLTVVNGNHTISAPVQLNRPVNVTVTHAADSLTMSGAITGIGTAFTASGAGTLVLTNALNTSGAFVNNNTGNVTTASIINTTGITSNSGNLTINGALTGGNGALTVNGGTLTLNGTGATNNTWSGKAFVNAGTLAVLNDANLGLASGTDMITMADGTTLRFLNGAALSASRGLKIPTDGTVTLDVPTGTASWAAYPTLDTGVLGSNTTINKTGTGQLNLTGNVQALPNYNQLNISGGVLQIANSILPQDNVTLSHGATLQFAGSGIAASTSRSLTVDIGGGSLLLTTGVSTWSGAIVDGNGTGTLTMPGAGNLVLSSNNVWNGGSIITGTGTLTLSNDGALSTGLVTWNSGVINGTDVLRTISNPVNLNGNGTINGTTPMTFSAGAWTLTGGSRTLTVTNTGLTTIASNIGQDVPGRGLTKAGAGALALSGTNTYSGPTTINAGSLQVSTSNNLGDGSATNTLVFAGGTLTALGSFNSPRAVTLNATGGTVDTGGNTVSFSGVVGGTANLIKIGTGALALTNTNTYSGATNVNAGTLLAAANNSLGSGALSISAATVDIGATNDTVGAVTLTSGSILGTTGVLSGASYGLQSGNVTAILGGSGALTKSTTGSVTLSGANTYSGATNINAGSLKVSASNNLGSAANTLVFAGGTLTALANFDSPRAVTLNATGGTVDTGGNTVSFSGVVGGTANLTKTATGTLVLSGSNTYSGATNINAGVVSVGSSSNLGAAASTVVFNGGTLLASGIVSSTRNVTVNAGGGTVDDGGTFISLGNVDGTGAFTKASGGELDVTHVRTGNLTVNAGKLLITPNGQAAGASKVKTLTLGAAAKIDLSDNHLITTSPLGSATAGVYDGVTGMIQSGRGNGSWNGSTGIVTSQTNATASILNSIGVAKGSDVKPNSATQTALWAGQTITGTDTLVMYTYGGDANLDGKIDISDYGRIDFNIPLGVAGWYNGDFNYDGKIDISDYGIIDFNIGIQGAQLFTAGAAGGGGAGAANLSGVTAVPEPATVSLLGLSAVALLGSRRRRRRN